VLQAPLPEFSLAIWHGFTLPLAMSFAATTGGVLLYLMRGRLFAAHARMRRRPSGKRIAEGLIALVFDLGARIERLLDDRSLVRYNFLLLASAVALGAAGYWGAPVAGPVPSAPLDPGTLLGGLLLAGGALATAAWQRRRFVAVLMLGLVGLMTSLLFARFSAPDLALTQLLVEIVTVILVLLAMYFLPEATPPETGAARRIRDALLAVLAGIGVAALTYAMLTRSADSISAFHLAQSKPGGGGTNVVNVILVDFRGFDTLGEITVLAIAAVGILVMLKGLLLTGPESDGLGRPWSADRHPTVLSVVAKPLLPIALLVSAYLFLRGHNEPGGGFIAALVTGVALILQYIAAGSRTAEAGFRRDARTLIGAGILVAMLTGLGSWAFGYPFLTSTYGYVTLPVVGKFEVASAMLFDLGVFLGVVGTVLLILTGLGRLGPREETR
jgi:multicomponent K+:H+ antiporter subunit A